MFRCVVGVLKSLIGILRVSCYRANISCMVEDFTCICLDWYGYHPCGLGGIFYDILANRGCRLSLLLFLLVGIAITQLFRLNASLGERNPAGTWGLMSQCLAFVC